MSSELKICSALTLLTIASLSIAQALPTPAATRPAVTKVDATHFARKPELQYQFQCSSKVDKWVCERQMAVVRNIVERQNVALPAGWTWLVVADTEWPALQRRYRLKHDYAFTHMGERRTVFNSLLFQQFDRPVWEWAVAHESAHVVCDLADEEATERVAREVASTGFLSSEKSCANLPLKQSGH